MFRLPCQLASNRRFFPGTTPSPGFGPRLFAAIGGGTGATILIVLSLVSVFRFWTKNRRIVWGNLLIVVGTFAAAWGGTGLALGEAGGFAFSLLLAVTFIWAGYRVSAVARRNSAPQEAIVPTAPAN